MLGAGTMGHGIAQVAAAAGFPVVLRDPDRDALVRGLRAIEANLDKGIRRGKVTEHERDMTLQRLRGAVAFAETSAADLFIEAVPERMDLKKRCCAPSKNSRANAP